ncbi:MAG: hypothetical protein FJW40_21415 [Acidobacteria bacterium]|nr:hypothetical protein [Acidobacteriota bacterium]
MSTAAQTTANQANAQLSTGPRTAEGKAASSQNALRHGLTSNQLRILPGEQEEFDALLRSLAYDLRPEGAIETVLFNDIVHASWQKRRARLLEAQADAATLDQLPQLDRLRRYHAHYDRLFNRALKTLLEIQRQRLSAAIDANQPANGRHIPLKLLRPPQPARPRRRETMDDTMDGTLLDLDLASFRTTLSKAPGGLEK